MDKKILIFVPNCLEISKAGYIKGFHKYFADCEAYYITSYEVFTNYSSDCIGCTGKKITSQCNSEHFLYLNKVNDSISVNGKILSSNLVVQIKYDYYGFTKSGMLDLEGKYGRHFQILSNILQNTECPEIQNGLICQFWKQFLLINIYLLNIILWVNIIHIFIKPDKHIFNSGTLKNGIYMYMFSYIPPLERNFGIFENNT